MFHRYPSSKKDDAYEIEQSLLFDLNDSPYLIRTPSVVGNLKTWTLSFWIKRAGLDTESNILNVAHTAGYNQFLNVVLQPSGRLRTLFHPNWPDAVVWDLQTNALFMDTSAWYHVVLSVNTTEVVASDRLKLYVNGELEDSFRIATYPPKSTNSYVNDTYIHKIGEYLGNGEGGHLNGYLSEFFLIDGQALGPEQFALTDDDGVYNPIPYTGTYGTNGFYLPFEASDIGGDESGNNNDFTTSGLTSDSVVADSPSNNYATLNPLIKSYGTTTFF